MKAGPGIGSIGTVVALVAAGLVCAGCGGETAVPAVQGDRQTQAQPSQPTTDQPQSSKPQQADAQPSPAPKVIVRGVNPPAVAAPAQTPEAVLPTPPSAPSPTPVAAPAVAAQPASTPPHTPAVKSTGGAVTIEKDSVIGIRLDHPLDTSTSRVDDKITAHVARDVVASGRGVIPAGAQLEGTVVLVERNRDGRDLPKIGVRFHTLVLGETRRIAIQTDPIVRLGGSSGGSSSSFAANTAAGATIVRGAPPPAGRRASPAGKPPVDVHVPAGSLLTLKLTTALTIDR